MGKSLHNDLSKEIIINVAECQRIQKSLNSLLDSIGLDIAYYFCSKQARRREGHDETNPQ